MPSVANILAILRGKEPDDTKLFNAFVNLRESLLGDESLQRTTLTYMHQFLGTLEKRKLLHLLWRAIPELWDDRQMATLPEPMQQFHRLCSLFKKPATNTRPEENPQQSFISHDNGMIDVQKPATPPQTRNSEAAQQFKSIARPSQPGLHAAIHESKAAGPESKASEGPYARSNLLSSLHAQRYDLDIGTRKGDNGILQMSREDYGAMREAQKRAEKLAQKQSAYGPSEMLDDLDDENSGDEFMEYEELLSQQDCGETPEATEQAPDDLSQDPHRDSLQGLETRTREGRRLCESTITRLKLGETDAMALHNAEERRVAKDKKETNARSGGPGMRCFGSQIKLEQTRHRLEGIANTERYAKSLLAMIEDFERAVISQLGLDEFYDPMHTAVKRQDGKAALRLSEMLSVEPNLGRESWASDDLLSRYLHHLPELNVARPPAIVYPSELSFYAPKQEHKNQIEGSAGRIQGFVVANFNHISQGSISRLMTPETSRPDSNEVHFLYNPSGQHWIYVHLKLEERQASMLNSITHASKDGHSRTIAKRELPWLVKLVAQAHGRTGRDDFAIHDVECPQQANGIDCGFFAADALESTVRGEDIVIPTDAAAQLKRGLEIRERFQRVLHFKEILPWDAME